MVPEMSVGHNVTLAALRECCVGPVIHQLREAAVSLEAIGRYGIKTSGPRQKISKLSGGNQQKAVIARTMLAGPEIVILDEPTRGIDVGAKAEVYEIVRELTRKGRTVILVSSELPELLALSDRILVMREGELTAGFHPEKTTQEEILKHAIPA